LGLFQGFSFWNRLTYQLMLLLITNESEKSPKIITKRSTIFMGIRERIFVIRVGGPLRRKPILNVSSGL
jgi:hypothetical protein